jgi:hypothetical protein
MGNRCHLKMSIPERSRKSKGFSCQARIIEMHMLAFNVVSQSKLVFFLQTLPFV